MKWGRVMLPAPEAVRGGLFPITLEQFVVFAVVQRAARAGRDAGRG